MEKNTYKLKLKSIDNEANIKKKHLAIEYARLNNPYKINDKITDHIGSVIIKKIQISITYGNNLPECIYIGDNLTKAGKIHKREPVRTIYQSNIIKN